MFSTAFSIGILQSPCRVLQEVLKVPNTRASCTCNFEASARPINILTQKGHTPCYLLDADIKRNLKGWVPVENTSTQKNTPNGQSHTIRRVKRRKTDEFFLRANVKLCRFCPAWDGNKPCTSSIKPVIGSLIGDVAEVLFIAKSLKKDWSIAAI